LLLPSLVLAQDWAGLRLVALSAALNVINAALTLVEQTRFLSRLILMITTLNAHDDVLAADGIRRLRFTLPCSAQS
jgi:hypothetical protein